MEGRTDLTFSFFPSQRRRGKGEGAGGAPSLVKGRAVGYEAQSGDGFSTSKI